MCYVNQARRLHLGVAWRSGVSTTSLRQEQSGFIALLVVQQKKQQYVVNIDINHSDIQCKCDTKPKLKIGKTIKLGGSMNRHFQSAKAPKEYQLQVNKWRSALYFFMVKMRLCALHRFFFRFCFLPCKFYICIRLSDTGRGKCSNIDLRGFVCLFTCHSWMMAIFNFPSAPNEFPRI